MDEILTRIHDRVSDSLLLFLGSAALCGFVAFLRRESVDGND